MTTGLGLGGDSTGAISAGRVAGVSRTEGLVYRVNEHLDRNQDGLACGAADYERIEG